MSLAALCISTCDVHTQVPTKSSLSGAPLITPTAARLTGISCRYEQLASDVILAYGRLGVEVDSLFYFPVDNSLTTLEILIFNSAAYEIKSVKPCYGRKAIHHYEVMAKLKAGVK